jgi:putative DNA primase/helicase
MSTTARSQNANSAHNASLQYAGMYLAAGYCPIPVKPRSKMPCDAGWQKLRLTEEQLPDHFLPSTNVGVVLGEPSSGVVDVDLDNANALKLAPYFLPKTDFIFGRPSKPASHWIYRTQNPGRIKKLAARETIVEVRGTGGQTVFPGSIHESGETIEFSYGSQQTLPVPTETTREFLDAAAIKIAVASVLVDGWTQGKRHAVSLAIAGTLVKRGWTEDDALQLVEAAALSANDEEVTDRLVAVRDTFANHRSGQSIKGWTALVDAIGTDAAKFIEKFLGPNTDHGGQPPPAANSNCQWTITSIATDDDAAKTFAENIRPTLRYGDDSKQWYRREIQVFEPVADAIAQGVVSDFAQMAHKLLGHDERFPKAIKSRSRINAVLELSRSRLTVPSNVIDSDRNLVGLSDGRLFDLRNSDFVTREDVFVTKKLGATFDPAAQCPRWLNFLKTIFAGNRAIIDFVQRAVGYSLSGETVEQCLFIMTGTGANGKSTFINAVREMFGDYGGTTPMQTLTVSHFSNGQTNDLAAMEGKRFISASDGEVGQRLAESKIKNMTGGDRIACRALYKDFREYDPQFKLWVATNDLPEVSGTEEAIWRRIRVIKFPVTISEQDRDPNLTANLAAEASGILNWALEGYAAWKTGGLKPPAEVTEATGSYRRENDVVGQFIEARCVENPNAKSSSKTLYENYAAWCGESGQPQFRSCRLGKSSSARALHLTRDGAATGGSGLTSGQSSRRDETVKKMPSRQVIIFRLAALCISRGDGESYRLLAAMAQRKSHLSCFLSKRGGRPFC